MTAPGQHQEETFTDFAESEKCAYLCLHASKAAQSSEKSLRKTRTGARFMSVRLHPLRRRFIARKDSFASPPNVSQDLPNMHPHRLHMHLTSFLACLRRFEASAMPASTVLECSEACQTSVNTCQNSRASCFKDLAPVNSRAHHTSILEPHTKCDSCVLILHIE